MEQETPLRALQRELSTAGPGLIGNNDILRGVLSGCGDCIKILDLDGRLQFMSEGGKRVMEVEDFDSIKGCPWPDFWTGEGNAHAIAALAEARAGRTGRFRGGANTAKGNARHWDVQVSPIFDDGGQVSYLLSISRDVTAEWAATQALNANLERQVFLTAELTHRVKNTLATVLALSAQTFRGDAHKQPREIFERRISTLSDAYNILTEASWSSGSMKRVIESALAPYRTGTGRFTISGPDHQIKPAQALTLALAVNELATNAMKYGALSRPSGKIDVSWSVTDALRFEWRETGGPTVQPPTRVGFGTRLIRNLLAGDFQGAVALRYDPDGLICRLTAPINA